ncbi:MAG: radical SAM protein [Oscillospiraceae bacterium]|nr:radical SAM protein [Oscillospiraceae bacterium]
MSDDKEFNLGEYLSNGVENVIKGALKASFSNPKESLFMAKYVVAARKASKLRNEAEKNGEHIPPFLIASITSSCNLHCAGCYSRAIDSCNDCTPEEQLDGEAWGKIFREASDLGISFIFLAGGEPLIRKDVIKEAAAIPEILFPVITNGTLLKGDYLTIFEQSRNLLPVISMEGSKQTTDQRRGNGVYLALEQTMDSMKKSGILFGVSITVTTENLQEVLSEEFVERLFQKGCQLVIYIEYVPAEKGTEFLAPGDNERAYTEERLLHLRSDHETMMFLSFPGDERAAGGCLAAGRGFFHINSHGGAEPCPFSPYSDINVRDTSVREALHSKLFTALQDGDILTEDHTGGCVLFNQSDSVERLLANN